MGHHTAILIFGIFSFMGWYGCVFSTKRLIQKGGLHENIGQNDMLCQIEK